MSNSLIPLAPHLPPFLQAMAPLGTFSNSAFTGGISMGVSHPKLSIKGSKFALIGADGERQALNTLALDVVLVGANPAVTKAFYLQAFDPNAGEFKAPDCFSDNGVAPSDRSIAKQAPQCGICPRNVWGSGNNGKGKACQDNKRLAVMLANSEDDRIFELRIPPTSLKSLAAACSELEKRGVPVPSVVFQLSFADVQHPELQFNFSSWVSEEQAPRIIEVLDSDRVKEVIGTTEAQQAASVPQVQSLPQMAITQQPTPVMVQPQTPQFAQQPQETPQPVQIPQPQVEPIVEAPKAKKGRPPKAAPSFLDAGATPAPVAGATPVGYQPTPVAPPSAQSAPAFPVQPQMVQPAPMPAPQGFAPVSNTDAMGVPGSTSVDLDNMLDGIL